MSSRKQTAASASDERLVWAAALAFAVVVSCLKILQARRLQNQAWDMGIYANMLWNTAHGLWFHDSIKGVNYLGDHFSPGLALLAPLLRLWPDAAVLAVAQSAALALGIPAVHRLAWDKTKDRTAAAGMALLYALSPLVHESSAHDIHAVTFAVPLLLWGLVLPRAAGLAALAAAGTLQEDLWLCAAAAAWHRRERAAAAGFVAAFAASFFFMRACAGGFQPVHWSFYSPANIAASLATADRLKGALRLLIPLGGLPLLGGADALPLLVPLAYTWIGANPHQGRLDLHYGAPLIPFLFLAAAAGWRRLAMPQRFARPAFLLLALIGTFWLPRYSRPLSPAKAAAAVQMLGLVPSGVPVCASFDLVPPLALREEIRLWTPGEDPPGSWIALDAAPSYFENTLQKDEDVRDFLLPRTDRLVFASEWLYLLKPRTESASVSSP